MSQSDITDSSATSRRRRLSQADNVPPTKRQETTTSALPDVRFVPVNTDFGPLMLDPAHYVAIVIPKSMQTIVEGFLKQALSKANETIQISDDVEEASNNERESDFLLEFGNLKQQFDANLKDYTDDELKREAPRDLFAKFKEYRRALTKWYVSCQHLSTKLSSESQTHDLLKTRVTFSPAVKDEGIKTQCKKSLKKTVAVCESKLTANVLDNAMKCNEEILALFADARKERDDPNLKMFVKAYRAVLQHNRHLNETGRRPFVPARDRERKPFRPRTFHRNYPDRNEFHRRRPSRGDFYRSRVNDDYPPMRRRNYDYRRFKRRPHDFEESLDGVDDLADDEVFDTDDRPRPYFRRRGSSFRRGSFRRF